METHSILNSARFFPISRSSLTDDISRRVLNCYVGKRVTVKHGTRCSPSIVSVGGTLAIDATDRFFSVNVSEDTQARFETRHVVRLFIDKRDRLIVTIR